MKRIMCVGPHLLAAATLMVLTPARSEERIGIAVITRNDVNGVLSSRTVPINAGEDVFGKEIVKTGQESSAKLVFADSTNLAVGPSSAVTLDNFIYAGPSDYKKATLTLAKGAFRFTTGNSDKRAYDIKTGVATIGVRGTVFDTISLPNKTIVTVNEGVVLGCSSGSYRCTVVHAGETAIFTPNSASNQGPNSPNAVNFASIRGIDPETIEVTPFRTAMGGPSLEGAPGLEATGYAVSGLATAALAGGIGVGAANSNGRGGNLDLLPPLRPTSP